MLATKLQLSVASAAQPSMRNVQLQCIIPCCICSAHNSRCLLGCPLHPAHQGVDVASLQFAFIIYGICQLQHKYQQTRMISLGLGPAPSQVHTQLCMHTADCTITAAVNATTSPSGSRLRSQATSATDCCANMRSFGHVSQFYLFYPGNIAPQLAQLGFIIKLLNTDLHMFLTGGASHPEPQTSARSHAGSDYSSLLCYKVLLISAYLGPLASMPTVPTKPKAHR